MYWVVPGVLVRRIMMTAFWDMPLCSPVQVHRRFREEYSHHQGDDGGSTYLSNVRQSTSIRLHGAISQKSRHLHIRRCERSKSHMEEVVAYFNVMSLHWI
jgi:hypothetical protein